MNRCLAWSVRPFILSIIILLLTVLCSSRALATSTGLNNIPTADTPPDRTFVFQSFTNMGSGRDTDYFAGFKMGLQPFGQRLEWGLDSRFAEEEGKPAVLQFKYAAQPWGDLPAVAVGVTNVALRSEDRLEIGQTFSFAVLSHDFGWFRSHAGYGFQHDNDAAFLGFDKTIEFMERDLMLRSDFIQIDNQDQWLGSAGFIYFMHNNFALESWMSQPFEQGKPFYTVKINLIFEF